MAEQTEPIDDLRPASATCSCGANGSIDLSRLEQQVERLSARVAAQDRLVYSLDRPKRPILTLVPRVD
jgi:hypothetical protein